MAQDKSGKGRPAARRATREGQTPCAPLSAAPSLPVCAPAQSVQHPFPIPNFAAPSAMQRGGVSGGLLLRRKSSAGQASLLLLLP